MYCLTNWTWRLELLLVIILLLFPNLILKAQSWERINDAAFHVSHSNGFGFNGKGYVIQGGPILNNVLWEYTPETDSWAILKNFPGRKRATAIGDDWQGKYYYGFGGTDLNDLWVFDPIDTSFTELPTCPCEGRGHPALVAHNDKVFMGAGGGGSNNRNDWWEYDMLTMLWTQKADIPGEGRHHPFQFASGQYVYVGGGHVDNWSRYDILTEEWTAIDDTPEGRVAGSQFSYKGLGFLIGGDDKEHANVPNDQTFMLYTPDIDNWTKLPAPPRGSRWANSSMIIDDVLYYFGGIDRNNSANDSTMWKFDMTLIDCLPVENPRASYVDTDYADLIWTSYGQSNNDTLKWRALGETTWNQVLNPQVVYRLDGLEACQEYEFLVVSECASNTSQSDTFLFKTEGCMSETIDVAFSTNAIRAYPNPFNEVLGFKSERANLNGYNLVFKNLLGERILSVSDYSLDKELNVSSFIPGIYFLTIEKDLQRFTIKLIKN